MSWTYPLYRQVSVKFLAPLKSESPGGVQVVPPEINHKLPVLPGHVRREKQTLEFSRRILPWDDRVLPQRSHLSLSLLCPRWSLRLRRLRSTTISSSSQPEGDAHSRQIQDVLFVGAEEYSVRQSTTKWHSRYPLNMIRTETDRNPLLSVETGCIIYMHMCIILYILTYAWKACTVTRTDLDLSAYLFSGLNK